MRLSLPVLRRVAFAVALSLPLTFAGMSSPAHAYPTRTLHLEGSGFVAPPWDLSTYFAWTVDATVEIVPSACLSAIPGRLVDGYADVTFVGDGGATYQTPARITGLSCGYGTDPEVWDIYVSNYEVSSTFGIAANLVGMNGVFSVAGDGQINNPPRVVAYTGVAQFS